MLIICNNANFNQLIKLLYYVVQYLTSLKVFFTTVNNKNKCRKAKPSKSRHYSRVR